MTTCRPIRKSSLGDSTPVTVGRILVIVAASTRPLTLVMRSCCVIVGWPRACWRPVGATAQVCCGTGERRCDVLVGTDAEGFGVALPTRPDPGAGDARDEVADVVEGVVGVVGLDRIPGAAALTSGSAAATDGRIGRYSWSPSRRTTKVRSR